MQLESLLPSQLSAQQRQAWQALRAGRTGFDNPFFALEFFELLEKVRGDVEILVLRDGGGRPAFWPIERRGRTAHPAGMRVSDLHGPLAPREFNWQPKAVLRQLRLSAWSYGCAPTDVPAFEDYHLCRRRFPCIRLDDGFDAYVRERKQRGSDLFDQVNRKARKLQREHGPLRFEWNTADEAVFTQLVAWKSDQYRRTGVLDLFRFGWVRDFVQQARGQQSATFAGVSSALYVGERLIAVHVGLRSGNVLALWFPVYDPAFGRYSPGAILTQRMIEAACAHGAARIDLGTGTERYKQSLTNANFEVAEGTVHTHAWNRAARKSWIQLREWAHSSSPYAAPLRLLRAVRNRLIHS